MKPTLEIDARNWQRTANELLKHTSRSLVDFTNGQARSVLTFAIRSTEKANRREIEKLMGSTATEKTRSGRGGFRGWVRIKREVGRGSVADKMLGAYFRKHGTWPVQGATQADRIRRLVAVKVKSVGMLKAGWINALNTLRKVTNKNPMGMKDLTRFGSLAAKNQLGGYAIPAREKWGLIEAIAVNEAPAYQKSHRQEKAWLGTLGDPMPVLIRGLQKGFQKATADMINHLARKLKYDLKGYGAR